MLECYSTANDFSVSFSELKIQLYRHSQSYVLLHGVRHGSLHTWLVVQVMDFDEKDRKVTLLLGDIGGTNCRFELVDADLRTRERLKDGTFAQVCPLRPMACLLRLFDPRKSRG